MLSRLCISRLSVTITCDITCLYRNAFTTPHNSSNVGPGPRFVADCLACGNFVVCLSASAPRSCSLSGRCRSSCSPRPHSAALSMTRLSCPKRAPHALQTGNDFERIDGAEVHPERDGLVSEWSVFDWSLVGSETGRGVYGAQATPWWGGLRGRSSTGLSGGHHG